jgi:DDE superfamily endonuclease
LEYLPPYSPDFNPIEEAFSQIKSFIHRNSNIFLSSVGAGIMYDLLGAMTIVNSDDAEGYIAHAGY